MKFLPILRLWYEKLNERIHDTYKVKTINKNLSLAGIMKWKIFP